VDLADVALDITFAFKVISQDGGGWEDNFWGGLLIAGTVASFIVLLMGLCLSSSADFWADAAPTSPRSHWGAERTESDEELHRVLFVNEATRVKLIYAINSELAIFLVEDATMVMTFAGVDNAYDKGDWVTNATIGMTIVCAAISLLGFTASVSPALGQFRFDFATSTSIAIMIPTIYFIILLVILLAQKELDIQNEWWVFTCIIYGIGVLAAFLFIFVGFIRIPCEERWETRRQIRHLEQTYPPPDFSGRSARPARPPPITETAEPSNQEHSHCQNPDTADSTTKDKSAAEATSFLISMSEQKQCDPTDLTSPTSTQKVDLEEDDQRDDDDDDDDKDVRKDGK
jgi:hypothetical protein